ncbi:cutinase family protein [Mycobacterium lepromatosis]|uniref:cutinase family protein n=1 Tax=Mycobacterium lepromatosis TaxID=480418 RepID=UPI001872F5C4|nr:cutinase family protein [Mycobacterium lepromatosis]
MPRQRRLKEQDSSITVIDGIRDVSSHAEYMAANCPKTRKMLSVYAQGAAVAGYAISAAIPTRNICRAAVMLFGTPSDYFLQQYGAPPIAIGLLYQPKTLKLCAVGDAICGEGGGPIAHAL